MADKRATPKHNPVEGNFVKRVRVIEPEYFSSWQTSDIPEVAALADISATTTILFTGASVRENPNMPVTTRLSPVYKTPMLISGYETPRLRQKRRGTAQTGITRKQYFGGSHCRRSDL